MPNRPTVCGPKATIDDRPLMSPDLAGRLEDLFKLLANDSRLRLLQVIAKRAEIRAGDLAVAVGMTPQAVSNQLQRLQAAGITASRREGINILYRIADDCVLVLMERGLCLLEEGDRRRSGRPVRLPSPLSPSTHLSRNKR